MSLNVTSLTASKKERERNSKYKETGYQSGLNYDVSGIIGLKIGNNKHHGSWS